MASLLRTSAILRALSQAPQPLVDEGPLAALPGSLTSSLGALDLLGPATGCLLDDGLGGPV